MNNLLLIAGAACGALFLIEIVGIGHLLKLVIAKGTGKPYHGRIKPFDCPPCLSFWIGAVSAFFLGKNAPDMLCIGVISSILAVLIKKTLDK